MHLERNNVHEGTVLIDGRSHHYLRAGSGPPLLLLHGLVGSLRNWRLNIEPLAETTTVYALDLLNMGQSDRVHGLDAGLASTADQVLRFMDALDVPEADIAGHSHGGAIALTLAVRHPDRVRRLILFAPANPFCHLGQGLIRFYNSRTGRVFAGFVPTLPRWAKAIALGRMYGDPRRVPADALDGYIEGLKVAGTIHHILNILRSWIADMAHLRSDLPMLAPRPILLIWGESDRAVGLDSARQLQRVLPQARLVTLPGVGHIPFEELPDACNQAMLQFLRASPA